MLPALAGRKLRAGRYDLVFVGFYGHLIMLRIPTAPDRKILFDAFLSTYDTLTGDRQRFSPGSLGGRLALHLDKAACHRADHILVDTPQHAVYFHNSFHLSSSVISALPVGCNESLFRPVRARQRNTILFYSSFQPLHGAETVVRAAAALREKDYIFKLIGSGQTLPAVKQLARQFNLKNIQFSPPIPIESLPKEIAEATLCLGGHFGKSEKASRVIPGKIYQILAMQRPVIAANTEANLGLLENRLSAYLVQPGDPASLAGTIEEAMENPDVRENIAAAGRQAFLESSSESVITARLETIVKELTGK